MPTSLPRRTSPKWRCSGSLEQQFKTLRDETEFNLVASRSAQAAVLKAIKEGKANVDFNAPVTPEGGTGGENSGNTDQGGNVGL